MKRESRWWKVLRRGFVVLVVILFLGGSFVVWVNFAAVWAGRGHLHDEVEEVPEGAVALVFGCDDQVRGRENLYFRYRIDAAEKLWKAGKVRGLIVSGDNRSRYYNEPEKMKRALIERGVPGDRIVCDYAGLRTLDSVVRAQEVFGAEELVLVSQRFQNERAAYLADAHGIRFSGLNAQDVEVKRGLKTKMREVGARVKMWLDVWVLKTRPKHLGDEESLPW